MRIEQRSNGAAGSTSSLLTIVPSADDHQAVYKCKVWNKAMGDSAAYERDFMLQVECKYPQPLLPALSPSVRPSFEWELFFLRKRRNCGIRFGLNECSSCCWRCIWLRVNESIKCNRRRPTNARRNNRSWQRA